MMRSGRFGPLTPAGLAAAVLAVVNSAIAAEPPAGRAGGLVPGTAEPSGGATREELIRAWDLDGDGSISKSEADVARARMKRKRLEIQLGGGIDPLTGLPRVIPGSGDGSEEEQVEEPLFQLPPEAPPSEPGRAKPQSPPGTRAPSQPSITGPHAARSRPGAASGDKPAATMPPTLSARASWLPPQRLAPAITGGVRAGAPAATGGYGAGAWSDLNAGRRPAPVPAESTGTVSGSTGSSGGLLPSARQPGRTGAMILPTLPSRPVGGMVPGLPPPPATGGITRPRVTADEIGAERP